MEMYLSHMVVFRIIEKMHLTKIFTNNVLSYITTSIIVIVGTIIFSFVANKVLVYINNKIENT